MSKLKEISNSLFKKKTFSPIDYLDFSIIQMSVEEKQARSVFVGNIPHGTTEDQMREIFSVIGPVLSFRIVFDRETGNPKGYGFAEYTGKKKSRFIY